MTHGIAPQRVRSTCEEMVRRAEQLFNCLPCSSIDLPRMMGISRTDLSGLLRFIRSRPTDSDGALLVPFTVAHGKRGPHGSWYVAILINKDKSYYTDRHNLDHVEDGAIGTLKEAASKFLHLGQAIECFAAGIRQGAVRWYVEDCARTAIRKAEDIRHFLKRVEQARGDRESA